jgi:hypothetical protein
MKLSGGCYCKKVRYEAQGEPLFRVQCHCRECQYLSGGNPNVIIGMPEAGFAYTEGTPRQYRRSDLDQPVTREFCPDCGTHLLTRSPRMPGKMLIKVGTLDDPGVFGQAQVAIFTTDKQSFHHVPEGIPAFERRPDSYT